jgi:hypothetical protein
MQRIKYVQNKIKCEATEEQHNISHVYILILSYNIYRKLL